MNIRHIILTRWVLAILRGDDEACRMYEAMDLGTPDF
jgi:hypothetical protein